MATEHEEQAGFVKWFRENYPSLMIFAIPNGDKRHISVAKRLKTEGVLKGIPDLQIVLPDEKVLWVEMKKEDGKLSQSQKDILSQLDSLHHNYIIGCGCVDASKQVSNYLSKKYML